MYASAMLRANLSSYLGGNFNCNNIIQGTAPRVKICYTTGNLRRKCVRTGSALGLRELLWNCEKCRKRARELPDMKSALERGGGVMEKLTQKGRLREFHCINRFHLRTRGRGSKNSKILRISYLEAPQGQSLFLSLSVPYERPFLWRDKHRYSRPVALRSFRPAHALCERHARSVGIFVRAWRREENKKKTLRRAKSMSGNTTDTHYRFSSMPAVKRSRVVK